MRYADSHCKYREDFQPNHQYVFSGMCIHCKQEIAVSVPAKELNAYRRGALIQDAMSSLSSSDREFLISGICGKCWEKVWDDVEVAWFESRDF